MQQLKILVVKNIELYVLKYFKNNIFCKMLSDKNKFYDFE
jgi:hypothetical protein